MLGHPSQLRPVEVGAVIDEDDGRVQALVRQVCQEEVGSWNDPLAHHGAIAVDDYQVRPADRRGSHGQGPSLATMTRSAAGPKSSQRTGMILLSGVGSVREDAPPRGQDDRRDERSQHRSSAILRRTARLRRFAEPRLTKLVFRDDPADRGAGFHDHGLQREGRGTITPVRAAGRVVDEEDLQQNPPTAPAVLFYASRRSRHEEQNDRSRSYMGSLRCVEPACS